MVGPTSYSLKFKIPADAVEGTYKPGYFNRSDRHGNFEDKIGAFDEIEKTIVKNTGLIIVPLKN